ILLWMFGGFLSAISVGTQAMTARRTGADDVEGAGAVSTNSLLVAIVSSLVVTAVCYLAAPAMFRLVRQDQEVLTLGIPFLRWRFLQICGMVITISLKAFFDGLGKTRVHMGAALTMNIANFFLCVGLIFGRGGLPRMGVPGAGLASMISSY